MNETKAESIIDKIKKVVFGEEEQKAEESVEQVTETKAAFMDATLDDGTLLNIEPAFEVGAAVVVIDAEGNVTPAEDSTHTLASGEVFVTVEGVITEIQEMPAEEVEEVEEEEMATEPTETQEQKVKKVVESIIKESHFASVDNVSELETRLTEAFNTQLNEAKEEIKNIVFEAFTKFSEEPTKEPTKQPKNKFQVRDKKTSWTDKLKSKNN